MKKIVAMALSLSLCLSLCTLSVSAAGQDITFTKSQEITKTFVKYNNFVVKSGANVKLKNCGFEIAGSLVVEPGASLTCSSARGDFSFSLLRGCTVSGLDLYYPQENGDGTTTITKIPVPLDETWSSDVWSQMNPSFQWNSEVQGWCLTWTMRGNPFNVRLYHTGRDRDNALQAANRLHTYGLFNGVGLNMDGSINYDLWRKGTRVEALTMLIRLLGKDSEAQNGEWTHPFTDVPDWADRYIGYAYTNGLTTGVSATQFGVGDTTLQQYLTFILRALGYSDEDTSSTLYSEAIEMAGALQLYTDDGFVAPDPFWRADMVILSDRALDTNIKNGGQLIGKLQNEGVVR